MVKVVVERELCDPCVHVDAVDDPHAVVVHRDLRVDGRGGKAGLCQLHDRLFEATILLAYRLQEQADAERAAAEPEAGEQPPPEAVEGPAVAIEPAKDGAKTAAALPPAPVADAVPKPRQEPIPSVEPETPVKEEPTRAASSAVVCVTCRERGEPAEVFTVAYTKRRDHANQQSHRVRMFQLSWEGDELRFPCTNLGHTECQRTRFSFPSAALATAHSNDVRAASLRNARATKAQGTQQALRESGVPLVACPLQHDIEEPFLVSLAHRSNHARTSHRLHAGQIDWLEEGTPLPLVCNSTTAHHKECTGRLRFPDTEWLNNHLGFTGAAKTKMLQAGTLLPMS